MRSHWPHAVGLPIFRGDACTETCYINGSRALSEGGEAHQVTDGHSVLSKPSWSGERGKLGARTWHRKFPCAFWCF